MNKKFLSVLAISTIMASIATGCGPTETSSVNNNSSEPTTSSEPTSSSETSVDKYEAQPIGGKCTLKMAVNYSETNTGMKYDQATDYTTPKGTVIKNGDWKPVYSELQSRLNFDIDDVTPANKKTVNVFKSDWQTNQVSGAELVCGNVSDIVKYSVTGDSESILDINEYLDRMPNFRKFLNENPTVKMSILTGKHSQPNKNAIYYLPYFDGMADLEKMTLLRADLVRKLLDEDNVDWDTNTSIISSFEYQPSVQDKTYSVTVPNGMNASGTKTFTKANTENIIKQQNEVAASSRNAKTLVAQMRSYIDAKYGNKLAKRSDLFLGADACYDADEMVALMRIARLAPKALGGSECVEVIPFVPREYNNQRSEDLLRWAGHLFGVRGVESRCGYLYLTGSKDEPIVHDARGDVEVANMIEKLNKLYKEGLILSDYEKKNNRDVTDGKFASNLVVGNSKYVGFMEYDYSQTQGVWNDKAGSKAIEGYDFRPIINGVAKWNDGDDSTGYFSFTESWRSVKTQGWCLNASLKNDEAKLAKALLVADYFYSEEGHNLNSYGPESEGYTSGTFNYQGRQVPKFTDAALAQLNDSKIGKGSYTDYLRKYVGATLPVGYVKEQGMEYQCTSENAKNGLAIINKAIEEGTFKHVELSMQNNAFYTIVPSAFNLTSGQVTEQSGYEANDKLGLINSKGSTEAWNMQHDYVIHGFGQVKGTKTLETKEQYLQLVNTTWSLPKLVKIYQDAYEGMIL